MKILGLIPARGGSKGIPGKNLIDLCGKPLLAWTAEPALAAGLSGVVLSTDDIEIAAAGQRMGLDVPFVRPDDLAQDDTPMAAVVRHAIFEIGEHFDGILLLQPTNPCRTLEDIRRAVELFERYEGRSAVVSVADCGEMHPFRMCQLDAKSRPIWLGRTQHQNLQRQRLPKFYIRDGGIYLIPYEWTFLNKRALLPPDQKAIVIEPAERSIRIDAPVDLERAAAWLKKSNLAPPAATIQQTRRARRPRAKRQRPAAPQSPATDKRPAD